jgi:hypothetical protein
MILKWDGDDCWNPAAGLLIRRGEHDYPDEHGPALLALGLTAVSAGTAKRAPKRAEEAE